MHLEVKFQHSYPDKGWEFITKAYVTTSDVPQFNVGHIVEYFITRTVCDSLPSADFKSMNRTAENLFRCGHVKNIKICRKNDFLFVKKSCIHEMRKDRVYELGVVIGQRNMAILQAECGCPAGRGPSGSCKHIAALCYTLADFCRLGTLPEFLTCTDTLQEWNRPRPQRIDLIPVHELGARRRQLLPPQKNHLVHRLFLILVLYP